MFGIGSTELLIIVVVALIIIGPSKLPEVMRTLGKGMAEFRRMSSDVKNTLNAEVERAEQEDRQKKARKELFPEEEGKKASGKAENTSKAPSAPPASEEDSSEEDSSEGHSEIVEELNDLPDSATDDGKSDREGKA